MNNYEIQNILGKGAFGEVYRSFCRKTQKEVAIKFQTESYDFEENGNILREAAILKRLQSCPHVVRLLDCIFGDDHHDGIFLVFELMEETLESRLKRDVSKEEVISIMRQLLSGLDFLKTCGIMHRDIKPANILVRDGVVKIADFGLSCTSSSPLTKRKPWDLPCNHSSDIMTLWWRAPEIELGMKDYGYAIDMWSLGCIFAQMIAASKEPLWKADCSVGQLFSFFQQVGTPDESSWPGVSTLPNFQDTFPKWSPKPFQDNLFKNQKSTEALDLLSRMMCPDPFKRIGPAEALQHPFFL